MSSRPPPSETLEPLQPTESNGDVREPPPPPNPSSDRGLSSESPGIASPDRNDSLFRLPPIDALKLLSDAIETLVYVTGDIPPTPPPTSPMEPNMRGMQAEKEIIVRSLSERSLLRLRQQAEARSRLESRPPGPDEPGTPQPIDGVRLREAGSSPGQQPTRPPQPYIVIGENSQPLNLQHSAIARKFYSKQPPPISIADYLRRMHIYCPMSTGVYLATSLYIHRLAVQERTIAVTRRNAHRLLLAGLRVAMKALEDFTYPHSKMAKVGGVNIAELARLEINFCFLTGFELIVKEDALRNHWASLRDGNALRAVDSAKEPVLKLTMRQKASG